MRCWTLLCITGITLLSTQEAPPLLPALASGRYQLKWTNLTDLPTPMCYAYVAVHGMNVYVAGGTSDNDSEYQTYVYKIDTNHWNQLPLSGHYYGVPHIIGGKLVIIGGRLSATKKRTNKVSTFEETSQNWIPHYPDLLSVRGKPGVITYLEYVIVAGGAAADDSITLDDIEVLNWIDNSHWMKVSIILPVPMWGFRPVIADDHLVIVGYFGADSRPHNGAYKIPVADITRPGSQREGLFTKMTDATHQKTALVPSYFPKVVVIGGEDNIKHTADIKIYDDSTSSWRTVSSLPSPRCAVSVASISSNAIIVIGGYNYDENSSVVPLATVQMGQVQLLQN